MKTVGATKDPIVTMGGVTITPDIVASDVTAESAAVLILIGGDTWQDSIHQPIVKRRKNF